ncbi:MAG: heme-binding protein [Pseudomonadota bacterium]
MSASETEIASYTTIKEFTDQKIEIRKYDTLILVETSMQGEGRNGAFGRLFKYISGANEKQSEIPMTAPVFMDDKGKTESVMSFVLPAGYTMQTAPVPTNKAVNLRELKDYHLAAIRFSGTLSDQNTAKHKSKLLQWLDDNEYKITGDIKVAGYNAPFTLPWLRRNEVLIPVELK